MVAFVIGWIGTFCFAFCGVPIALQCIRQGNTKGVAPWFLILWTAGEICYTIAVLLQFGWVGWMLFNYGLNMVCAVIVWRYYFRPVRTMKRCITCKHWFISSEPFEERWCIVSASPVDNAISSRTKPGHTCPKHERFESDNDTTQPGLAKSYLFALIGRERSEVNSLAHGCFCADASRLYKQLEPQMQINVHDAFRLFLNHPNY